jgi:hypothetical protein
MALISENEQVMAQKNYDQPKESQDIVKHVNTLFSRAKKHRAKWDRDWQPNYEFAIAGKQWPIERPRWRFNEAVNVTWSAIMTELAIQTDVKPKFSFISEEESDEEFSKVMQEISDRNWRKYNWSDTIFGLLFDSKIYKVGHALITWDPEYASGLGDICFRNLDPFYCYWDPRAETINKEKAARFFIYAEPLPTSQLHVDYPQFKDTIKSDVSAFTQRADNLTVGRIATSFDPYTVTRLPTSTYTGNEQYGGEPSTLLLKCWLRDDTLEEVVEESNTEDGTDSKEYVLKKKYPRGRYVEIANNTLLFDGEPGVKINGEWVPFEHGHIPIVRCVNYGYPREYVGEDEISQTKGPQKIINYIWSYILDSFKMNANPRVIISTDSGIDPEQLTNEPGIHITTNNMAGYRQEPGMAIAPNSLELLNQSMALFDKVQGLQDVSRGAEQTGVSSGVMLEGYVEAAQTRPRMKNRFLDSCLQDIGQLMLPLYLQFYKQQRVFRIVNKEGYPDYVEFYVSEDGKTAHVKRISTDESGMQSSQVQELSVKGEYDVEVVSGSALPFAKAQKAQTALAYYNAKAIDQEELLSAVDWPNKEQVMMRMQKAAEQQAQMEAQQAAMGAPK